MGKTVAKKETAVQAFDFELEVVETKALYDRWKGVALTWRSATVDLGRRLWRTHQELGGDDGKKGPKVRARTSKVRVRTIKDFYEAVGMPKRTFYDFIERIRKSIEEGVDIMALPGDMKLIEAATKKSQHEVELEEKLSKMEEEIAGRDEAIIEYEKAFKELEENATDFEDQIATLKAKLEGGENPELIARIEKLEKKEALLAQKINWTGTATTFKKRLQSFCKKTSEISELAETLFESVPKETKNN